MHLRSPSQRILSPLKRVGPRVGKLMPAVKKALGEADGGELLKQLNASGKVVLELGDESVELDDEDLQVRLQAKEGWAAAQGPTTVVVLSTELTPELIREGLARDINRLIQDRRKQLDCEFTDHIEVGIVTESAELRQDIDNEVAGAYIEQSILGRAGHFIEPAVRPLGWDWKIGCAAIASFPAREVIIGTLGVIYNLGDEQDEHHKSTRMISP